MIQNKLYSFAKLKQDIDVLFSQLLPHLRDWALQSNLSCTFLSFILWDVEVREQQARAQVHIDSSAPMGCKWLSFSPFYYVDTGLYQEH